jgi:predicted NAD/FAD-dependent oxidoreductase
MKLLIVGAGISGLATAYTLTKHAPDIDIHCIEKSRGVGGRAATRRRHNAVFDHGAQFFRTNDESQLAFFRNELDASQLVDIHKPVWTFTHDNILSVGDSAQNSAPKLVYRAGINQLGKLLKPEHLSISFQQRIAHITQEQNTIRCFDADQQELAQGDAIVFTPPAPQIIDILRASHIDTSMQQHLIEGLTPATYRPCLSITMAFDQAFDFPFYALVNSDRQHDISWLAFEHDKDISRAPAGQSLITIQLAPSASKLQWDDDVEILATRYLPAIASLLHTQLPQPLWIDRQGWRYALPDGKANTHLLQMYERSHGVYFAGDALFGLGRVHLALQSGIEVAHRIISQYSNRT